MTHLALHVPSLSVESAWDLPLWAWRQFADWQDQHLETYKKLVKQGVHCDHC